MKKAAANAAVKTSLGKAVVNNEISKAVGGAGKVKIFKDKNGETRVGVEPAFAQAEANRIAAEQLKAKGINARAASSETGY